MAAAFGPIVDALLRTSVKSLKSVYWHVPAETLPKVIWALDALKGLVSVHVEFDRPEVRWRSRASLGGDGAGGAGGAEAGGEGEDGEPHEIHLGAAAGLNLTLPNLAQLSVTGHCQDFLEQAAAWTLPALASLSFDFGLGTHDLPDLEGFLTAHGGALTFLDLHCGPALDCAALLELCPRLATLCFNADWVLPEGDTADDALIVRVLHAGITHVGLHGLLDAFGVGFGSDALRTHMLQRTNERNVRALSKAHFPALRVVRALSRPLLRALEANDGPQEGCMARWDAWWAQFSGMGVRLEDCTGALLGTLPQLVDELEEEGSFEGIREEEDEYESESEESEEDDDDDEEEEDSEGEVEDLLADSGAVASGPRRASGFGALGVAGGRAPGSDRRVSGGNGDRRTSGGDRRTSGGGGSRRPSGGFGSGAPAARLKPEIAHELRQLLEECWKMSEAREEPVFPPFAMQY